MANSTYERACELGYLYIRGTPRVFEGRLCNRFTRTADGTAPAVYVGWEPACTHGRKKPVGKRWIIRFERIDGTIDSGTLAEKRCIC